VIRLTSLLETDFHRDLASPAWLGQLAAHVESAIRAISGFETCDGVGKVSSRYNEARYMGPNSIVRYQFTVDVVVFRATPGADEDRYQCQVRFHPDTNAFRTECEVADHQETRNLRRREAEQLQHALDGFVERLRKEFEGREAIHVGQGALRVRVSGIRAWGKRVVAEAEEVPTKGLQNSFIHRAYGGNPGPLRWKIETALYVSSPEGTWPCVRRGEALLFDPAIVQGLTALAATWDDNLPALARYCEIGCFLMKHEVTTKIDVTLLERMQASGPESQAMKAIVEKVLADPRYRKNVEYGEPRPGHPEGTVRAHIAEVVANLDAIRHRLRSDDDYWRLLFLVHVHDTFKADAAGNVPIRDPRSHASLARSFATEFTDDADLLNMIQFHDENYALWKEFRRYGTYDAQRFQALLRTISDWDLFLIFTIVDGATAGKDREKLVWFIGEVRKHRQIEVDESWIP